MDNTQPSARDTVINFRPSEDAGFVFVVGPAAVLDVGTLAVVAILAVLEELAASPVPVVSPVLPGVTALLTLQVPVRVGMTFMF
jgi:hypothetical protein